MTDPQAATRSHEHPTGAPAGMFTTGPFAMLLNNARQAVAVTRFQAAPLRRTLVTCNAAYAALAGLSREELERCENLYDLVTIHTPADLAEQIQKPYHGQRIEGMGSWRRPDGKANYCKWDCTAYLDGDDVYVLELLEDVTDQYIGGAGQKADHQWLRTILDSTEVLVSVYGVDGRILLINDAGLKAVDCRREQVIGKTFEELAEHIDGIESHVWHAHLETVIQTKRTDRFRYRAEFRGQDIWMDVTASPVIDADGQVTSVVFLANVINEQMRVEMALREQQQRMDIILRHSTDGINIVEIDEKTRRRRLVMCNDRYVEMAGRSREELMAMEDINALFTHPNPAYWERVRGGDPCQGRASWIRPDGKENYFEWTGAPVRIGDRLFVVGIDRDVTQRIQAEKKLREQQKQLELILEHSRDGINICRIDRRTGARRLLLCNDRFVEMSGHSRAELEASENLDDLVEIIEPRNLDESRREIRQGVSQQGLGRWRRQKQHDPDACYEWTAAPIFVGDELFVVGVDRDITQRRRSEAALRESERRFRAVFDGSSECILLVDRDIRILYMNAVGSKLAGVDPDGVVGLPFSAITGSVEPGRRDLWVDRFRQVFREARSISGTERVGFRGQEIWIDWTLRPVMVEPGEVTAVAMLHRDITEQRRAELELRQHQQRLELIMEHSTDGINIQEVVDRKTLRRRLLLCNDRFVEMSGRSREDLMSAENMNDLTIPLHSGLAENRQRMLDGEPFEGLSSWIRPDGKENVFEWTAAPIDVDGRLYLVGIDRDVTERRRAEEAVRHANRKLLSAREQERRRLARELHDSVSQSLVALTLSLKSILAHAGDLSGGAGEALKSSADRCSGLIQEVRSICHGLYPPALESLGLVPALRGLVRDFDDGPTVSLHCDELVDGMRFQPEVEIELFRIAQEALTNALRHSRAETIEMRLGYRSGRLTLAVVDDGIGYDASVHPSDGLGLNTMRERASSIRGRLEIRSADDGTSVRVQVDTDPLDIAAD